MQRMLEMIDADTVFLGTDAIDSHGRCLVKDPDMARTAQIMLRHARRKILLADNTKVDAASRIVYAALSDFDLWITTAGISANTLRRFRKQTNIVAIR